jgi:hypothetical protein
MGYIFAKIAMKMTEKTEIATEKNLGGRPRTRGPKPYARLHVLKPTHAIVEGLAWREKQLGGSGSMVEVSEAVFQFAQDAAEWVPGTPLEGVFAYCLRCLSTKPENVKTWKY